MRIALLYPVARSEAEPQKREDVLFPLAQGLISEGMDVTLFGLSAPDKLILNPRFKRASQIEASGYIHISELFERADEFDIIHNYGNHLAVTYSRFVNTPILTTVTRGVNSHLPVYRKYNQLTFFVSTSDAERVQGLDYIATVHHGIDLQLFDFNEDEEGYLLYSGPIDGSTGVLEAIEIARRVGSALILTGAIRDETFFRDMVRPFLAGGSVKYLPETTESEKTLMKNARALIQTGSSSDYSYMTAIRANAFGTPVIASYNGSLAEVIEQGINGFLVFDIEAAVAAAGKIKAISRKECRLLIERRFSRGRMVRDYVRVYSQILQKNKREDRRPWGYYKVLLDSPDHKVKQIVVYAGKRLSLQRHRLRSEHWFIVSGTAVVTRNNEEILLTDGESVNIPAGANHRVMNPGNDPLIFIEVQRGSYFGEDDIERVEDDFGRV